MIGRATRSAAVMIIAAAAVLVPTPAGAQDDDAGLRTVVSAISPHIPAEGDAIVIAGYVENGGDADLSSVSITLRVTSQPFIGRAQLNAYAGGRSTRAHQQVSGAGADLGDVDAGEIAPFRLRAPAESFGLGSPGVYGLEVSARSGNDVSAVHTFLTWMPEPESVPTVQVAWLVPLVDRPVRDQDGVFVDDHLAGALAPEGRLGTLIAAAQDHPVTWVVDADLLATAEAMTGGYQTVEGADGMGTAAASDWLDRLRQSVPGGADVVALPYADADLAALTRANRAGDMAAAAETGTAETTRILGATPVANVAWPTSGFADEALLNALPDAGYGGVILDSAAVPLAPGTDLPYTPTGRADIATSSGPVAAALSDEILAAILRQDTRQLGVGPLVIQRILAETAWIALEQPNRERAILVEPPRRWSPDPAVAADLLAGVDDAPWIEMIGITDLLAVDAPNALRAEPIFPEDARSAELPTSHVTGAARLDQRVQEFASVLSDPRSLTTSYATALLRAQSNAWSDGEGGVSDAGRSYLGSLRDDLSDQVDQIRIISHGTVTLSSNRGTVPVTIANDLNQPVQVRLQLTPRVASRLTVDEPQPVIIEPAARQTVEVAASAVASGITTVDAQLLTMAGEPIGSPTQFNVRATNFGLVGFVVIGGAMVLLVVSAAIRIIRRTVKKNHRRASRMVTPTERVKA